MHCIFILISIFMIYFKKLSVERQCSSTNVSSEQHSDLDDLETNDTNPSPTDWPSHARRCRTQSEGSTVTKSLFHMFLFICMEHQHNYCLNMQTISNKLQIWTNHTRKGVVHIKVLKWLKKDSVVVLRNSKLNSLRDWEVP